MQSFIGLGGNIGKVADVFQSALDSLNDFSAIRVQNVSTNYVTQPVGANAGEPFLNAAAELEVACSPLELLDALQDVEAQHGRKRETHWGPRTLDLDLLLFGEMVLDDPRLILPHPGLWYRRFVLDPLAEIAPDVLHPTKGLTIKELQQRLMERPLRVGITGGETVEREQLAAELSQEFAGVAAKPWTQGKSEPCILFWLGEDGEAAGFESLPLLPRLDLTRFPEPPSAAARHVLTAALGQV